MIFPVVMYRCENWTRKKALALSLLRTLLLEKTLESPLDCKEIKPVNPKGSQLNGHEFEQTPGESGVLQSMGLQRVAHDLVTKQ